LSAPSELKVVITAGGIGTRLLPFSKEIPKEMSPIILADDGASLQVKPIIQAIFEQLYRRKLRDFFIVVGRGKRAIEDHFTPDWAFLDDLKKKGKSDGNLEDFYLKIRGSNLVFVSQPEPLGFGDAVLRARPYISGEFLLHAGDTYIISEHDSFLKRLVSVHAKFEADATILLQEMKDPRPYGVVAAEKMGDGVVRVRGAVEKPEKPKSNLAILPVYIFNRRIFDALAKIRPGKGGEVQLTDGIQELVRQGERVVGVKLSKADLRLDIGSPETLMEALELSRKYSESSRPGER
jgi:UTP--glucose-1-phosphate uridylyltransferase